MNRKLFILATLLALLALLLGASGALALKSGPGPDDGLEQTLAGGGKP